MSIGDRVRQLRLERGWNASELARRSQLPPATISRIEQGINQPTSATMAKLARGLEVEPGELFPKAGSSPSPVAQLERRVRELNELFDEDPAKLRLRLEKDAGTSDINLRLAKRYADDLSSGPEKEDAYRRISEVQGQLARLLFRFMGSSAGQDLTVTGVERLLGMSDRAEAG